MKLTAYYLFFSKVLNRLSFWGNRLYRLVPLRWLITLKTRKHKNFDLQKCRSLLQEVCGDYSKYNALCTDVDARNYILQLADQAMEHQFDLLGSGPVTVDPIDWHCDFKTGFRWPPQRFYRDYIQVDYSNTADVKVPWELSRCHHLLWLGQAYLLTGDEKYAKEIVAQIESWIADNPLMYSINWTCAMDVAIRAVNWLFAVAMISNSSHVTSSFIRKFIRSLYEHGFFIIRNLEKTFPYSANHYAADIAGMLFLGRFFGETDEGHKWWNFALQEYYHEVRTQILPSGVHFERSTSYHRLMTEFFLYSFILIKKTDTRVPLDIGYRIESMLDFISNYTKPDGHSPVIGDNDDGRLLPFIKYHFKDHRYLLRIASHIFPHFCDGQYASDFCVDAFFLLNDYASRSSICEYKNHSGKLSSQAYPDAGFYILRHEDFYMFITNSEASRYYDKISKLYGTHTHADLLSFELAFGNTTFMQDPGSYVYTASIDERNKYRGTSMHNTLAVDGFDQHQLSQKAFLVSECALPNHSELYESPKEIIFEGAHDGYLMLDDPVLHSRRIHYEKATQLLTIIDSLDFNDGHEFSWTFIFAPEIHLIKTDNGVIAQSEANTSLRLVIDQSHSFSLEIVDCEVSPSYGIKMPACKLVIYGKVNKPFQMKTVISPILE